MLFLANYAHSAIFDVKYIKPTHTGWFQRSMQELLACYPIENNAIYEYFYKCFDGFEMDSGGRAARHLFDINPEPVSIRPECFYVLKTNSYFSAPCTLPPSCGKPVFQVLSTTWWGQELGVCHALMPIQNLSQNYLEVYSLASNADCTYLINDYEQTYSMTVMNPTLQGESEQFYVLREPRLNEYNIIPKSCLWVYLHFNHLGAMYEPTLNTRREGDDICYVIPSAEKINTCYYLLATHGGLQWRKSFRELIYHLNPRTYIKDLPFRCEPVDVPDVDDSHKYYVVVNNTGSYYTSVSPYHRKTYLSAQLTKDDRFIDVYESKCFHISTQYRDPVSSWVASALDSFYRFITSGFYQLLLSVESELFSIVEYILRIMLKVALYLVTKLPIFLLLLYLSIFTTVFFSTRNFVYSAYFSLLLLLLSLFIKTNI